MDLFASQYQHLPGFPCAWSPSKAHRYTLWRVWSANPRRIMMFCALNPSTATEEENDPTIRRGTENDEWLVRCAGLAAVRLAAWGTHGEFLGRADQVMKMIPSLHCLGTTAEGFPRHPLYVRGDKELERYGPV